MVSNFYNRLAEKIANILLPHVKPENIKDDYTFERLYYSTNLLIRDISKTLALFLIVIPFGIAPYILVFAIAYGWLGRVCFVKCFIKN